MAKDRKRRQAADASRRDERTHSPKAPGEIDDNSESAPDRDTLSAGERRSGAVLWILLAIVITVFAWVSYSRSQPWRESVQPTITGAGLSLVVLALYIPRTVHRLLRPPVGYQRDLLLWRFVAFGVICVNLYLFSFASLYFGLGGERSRFLTGPSGQQLTRLDAVYFAVTTFSTTGYGDWHPYSSGAKVLVISQQLSGFLLISVFLALVLSAFARYNAQKK